MKENIVNAVTIQTAPAESRPTLKKIQKTFGFIPNLMAIYTNRMKIRNRLVALAVCAWLPATLVAQPPNDSYQGAYRLKISALGVPWPISAFSMYEPDGTLKEIDYLPTRNFFGIEAEVGYGHWFRNASGQFVANYKTELPNGQVRQVTALTTLSPSGNQLTGTATVKLLNRDGTVADTKTVTVTGRRAPGRLATRP